VSTVGAGLRLKPWGAPNLDLDLDLDLNVDRNLNRNVNAYSGLLMKPVSVAMTFEEFDPAVVAIPSSDLVGWRPAPSAMLRAIDVADRP
jgi:hypothetical protein